MTIVKFYLQNSKVKGFEIKGHSGYAPQGEDIVCAAVSSAAYMAANTITEVSGAEADIISEDGYFKLLLKEDDSVSEAVLSGMKLHLMEVSKQYPQFISIIFGGVKNA